MCVFICVFFYGLFSPGRHACSGQSQLDMPERFLWEKKMGEENKKKKKKWKGSAKREISEVPLREKDLKREERHVLIFFIMYSNGEIGWDDHGGGYIFAIGTIIILRNNYQSHSPFGH